MLGQRNWGRELAWTGLLLGLAWWSHFLAIVYIAPIGIFLLLKDERRFLAGSPWFVAGFLAGSPAPDGSGGVVGYRVYTTYTYQVGAQAYNHRRMGAFFATQAAADQFQPEEPVGALRTMYYNPENPVEVLLERSVGGSLLGSLLGLLVAAGGGYWFFRPALRKSRRSSSRRRTTSSRRRS